MGGQFDAKYSDEQRRAIEHAYLDAAIRPATEIPRLAAAGQLVWQGRAIEPFTIPYATALEIGKAEERRRTGRAHSQLVNQPHQDAVEVLRRRTVSLLDHETNRLEREQRKSPNKPIDVEQLRKVTRTLRELASMPEPGTRGARPGAGARAGEPTGEAAAKDTSMAGSLRAALRGGAHSARPEVETHTHQEEEQSAAQHERSAAHQRGDGERINDGGEAAPGDYARSQLAGLSALAVSGPPAQ